MDPVEINGVRESAGAEVVIVSAVSQKLLLSSPGSLLLYPPSRGHWTMLGGLGSV